MWHDLPHNNHQKFYFTTFQAACTFGPKYIKKTTAKSDASPKPQSPKAGAATAASGKTAESDLIKKKNKKKKKGKTLLIVVFRMPLAVLKVCGPSGPVSVKFSPVKNEVTQIKNQNS